MGCRDFENQISLADTGEVRGDLNRQDGEKETSVGLKEIENVPLDGAQIGLVALEKSPLQSRALQVIEDLSQQRDPPADNPARNHDRGEETNHQLPADPPEPVGHSKFEQSQHEPTQHEQDRAEGVNEVLNNHG